ncbi:uncharacterized protein [Eurosta solidaginis]|uniref:uncharacterized protein isoform X2 n=1 Tax=Eurosta solidaginis TaxID=178769 RepID=UPI003530AAF7
MNKRHLENCLSSEKRLFEAFANKFQRLLDAANVKCVVYEDNSANIVPMAQNGEMPLFNTTINSNMSSQNNAKPLKMSFATSGDFTATAHAHAQPSVVKVSKTSNTERQTSPRKWTSHEPNDARYFDEYIGSEPKNYGTAVGKFGVKCSIFIEAGNQSSPTTTLAPPTRTLTTTPNCTPTLLWNRIYGGSSKEGGRHDVVVRNG